jgi:pimeloyl-ACP methyl ester carboxylesterase
MPFITVNGKTLNYADTKPESPESPTIIFVHGLGSTQNYFFPILPYLAAYRCITFDNYGAGRSKYAAHVVAEHSIASIGQDVIEVLDGLKVSKAIVVGYSMGGMLPTYLASTQAERVAAGVCIGPVHPSEAVAEVFKKRIPAVRDGEFGLFFVFCPFFFNNFFAFSANGAACCERVAGMIMRKGANVVDRYEKVAWKQWPTRSPMRRRGARRRRYTGPLCARCSWRRRWRGMWRIVGLSVSRSCFFVLFFLLICLTECGWSAMHYGLLVVSVDGKL